MVSIIAGRRTVLKIGDRVRVEYADDELDRYPYAKKLQGKEFIIADAVPVYKDEPTKKQMLYYYTLHDAVSRHGIPYCFTKDQLEEVRR